MLLDKGLKVNTGKSKVLVGSSGGKMIVNTVRRSAGKLCSVHRMYTVDSQSVEWCTW